MSDEILIGVADDVATVTLNRPDKRNAMNAALLRALAAAFDDLDARRDVRVIVVRGAGPAFCSGRDLRDMERGEPQVEIVPVLSKVEGSRHPTIAMIHGDAIAGGCELALHCDLRVAAEGARLGMPLARLGLVPGFALGQKLIEIIGPAHTRHLLLTGRPIEARRAREIGMVHEVAPAADLDTATAKLARTIADNAPLSLAGIKALIQRALAARETVSHDDIDALIQASRRRSEERRVGKECIEP